MADGHIENFKGLFEELMGYCLRRGIAMADAQDLVGAALESALMSFEPTRGSFAALAQTALTNRVRNHWRDRKPLDPIDGAGDVEDPDPRPDAFDDIASQQHVLRGIMAELTSEEKSFLLVLQTVLEEMDSRAVSEAARRMGMPASKGWDLFRKIQRKADRTREVTGRKKRASVAKRTLPPDLAEADSASMVFEAREMPAPSAPMAAFSPGEPVDASVRTLAFFVAMEDAYTHFRSRLSGDTLALIDTAK